MAFPGGRSETRNASTATERRSIETIQARYWKVLRHSFKMASALNRPKAALRDKQRCMGATAPTRCAHPTLSPANHEEIRLKSVLLNIRCLPTLRSEEHTSALQSLMRISYAIFCLKK